VDKIDRFSINNIRKEYLNFFKSKGHLTEQSFSLIPKNDNFLIVKKMKEIVPEFISQNSIFEKLDKS